MTKTRTKKSVEEVIVEEVVVKEPTTKKKRFWKTRVYIPGIGTVRGEATQEQINAFNAFSGGAADVNNYLSDKDELAISEAKAQKEALKKMGIEK